MELTFQKEPACPPKPVSFQSSSGSTLVGRSQERWMQRIELVGGSSFDLVKIMPRETKSSLGGTGLHA
eukprot:scaffold104956_cov28-Tisochrysis_lutea.AAC.2